jgi:HAD superfamily hydrolase (TIGR01509 family)
MSLRVLIFDVDGTLAETEDQGHRVAFNRAFADAGLPWHWDSATYARLLPVAGGRERIAHWCRHDDVAGRELQRADFEPWVAALHASKTRHYAALLQREGIQLRPGVARLVAQARAQGQHLAMATTTALPNVHELLAATWGAHAATWFSVIASGESVPRKKPAPDIYRWVVQQLGLQPHQALALEDSGIGARAALGAGVPVVVTRSHYTQHDTLPEGAPPERPLAVLNHLGEDTLAAQGEALGQPWRGRVDLDTLARWHAAVPGGPERR